MSELNSPSGSTSPLGIAPVSSLPLYYSNYKLRNLIVFNLSAFACIAFVVFLTSSQPFFITDVLGIDDSHIGRIIGTLGVFDELTCIVMSPLIGTLHDQINHSQLWLNGTRIIVMGGFVMIFASFFIYGLMNFSLWRVLVIPRVLFALGVTSCMSMVPVMLNQLVYSDFKVSGVYFWRHQSIASGNNIGNNSRYAAMVGMASGLGAIFSVSLFLTLPVRLLTDFDLSSALALQMSFLVIGCISFVSGLILMSFLYGGKSQSPNSHPKYFEVLRHGFNHVRHDSNAQLACAGGFVARSTSVQIAVFVPLYVYDFFHRSGQCDSDIPSKANCYDGYIFAAILTGVAQTMGLISSPFWGVLSDKFGRQTCLLASAGFGLIGNLLICVLNADDPRNVVTFILVSFIGISQIGSVITSMSLISVINNVVGSVSGIYNLCGGIGILILSQCGGIWSDNWIYGSFLLMSIFNGILILLAMTTKSSVVI